MDGGSCRTREGQGFACAGLLRFFCMSLRAELYRHQPAPLLPEWTPSCFQKLRPLTVLIPLLPQSRNHIAAE